MKILHTSDWHIGRKLEDKNLDDTLPYFFDFLIETINAEKIDVLVVAGDIFNSPYPSNSSLKLYYETLNRLSNSCLRHMVVVGGNHDSVSTLNAPKELLATMNITVVGGVAPQKEDLIVEVKNNENQTELVVCAIPFLREKDVRNSTSGLDFVARIKQISEGIEEFYGEIANLTANFKNTQIPVVATGHLFVNDTSKLKIEEKELFIGGLQQLSLSQFPADFDYIALGHVHKPMRIGKKEHIRYCGSPIHQNFGEINNKCQVVIVDFDGKTPNVEIKYVPIFRELLPIKGTLQEVETKLKSFVRKSELMPWASIEIIEEKIDPLMEMRIDNLRNETSNIEIIKFRYTNSYIQNDIEKKFENNTSIDDLQPEDIFEKILEDVEDNEKNELLATFKDLINNHLEE